MGVNSKLQETGSHPFSLVYNPPSTDVLGDGVTLPASPVVMLTDGNGNVFQGTDNGDGTFSIPVTAAAQLAAAASTYLVSASRTTTQTQTDQTNSLGFLGAHVIVDVTVNAGNAGSITVELDAKDPASGKYYPLISSAAITTTGTTVLKVFPGATPQTNGVADDVLPKTYRILVTANNANPVTYSVGLVLLP